MPSRAAAGQSTKAARAGWAGSGGGRLRRGSGVRVRRAGGTAGAGRGRTSRPRGGTAGEGCPRRSRRGGAATRCPGSSATRARVGCCESTARVHSSKLQSGGQKEGEGNELRGRSQPPARVGEARGRGGGGRTWSRHAAGLGVRAQVVVLVHAGEAGVGSGRAVWVRVEAERRREQGREAGGRRFRRGGWSWSERLRPLEAVPGRVVRLWCVEVAR